MEINIKSSQGVSQAIAEKLNLQGTRISKNVWEQVIGLVEAQNRSDGKIFGQNYGHDISGSSKSNFVVNSGTITLDDNIWNRICRLMGKPEACVDIKNETTDSNPTIQKSTSLAKAFSTITNALKNNQLGEVPSGFREALIKAYGAADTSSSDEISTADYVRSLLIETQKILGNTTQITEDIARNAMEMTVKICPDGELDGKTCSEYSKNGAIDEWLESTGLKETTKTDSPAQTGELSEPTKQMILEARNELINDINSGKIELPQGVNKEKVIEFLNSDAVLNPPAGVEIPNDKAAIKAMLLQVASIQPKQFSLDELQTKINNVREKLNQSLKGREFKGPNGKIVKGQELLDIINFKIGFEYYPQGAGRFDPKSGQVLLNLDSQYVSNSDAELMRLMIHEALHCAYNSGTDSQEEEFYCESQALQITAQIVAEEKENKDTTFTSYPVYGQNIEDFNNNPDLLNTKVRNWLSENYANYPKFYKDVN